MKFNHQALLVNDLNQSGDFYNNILGFEEIEVELVKTHLKDGLKVMMVWRYILFLQKKN